MASASILSPRPVDVTPAASLEVSQLDNVCSGSLEVLLEQASFSFEKKPSCSPANPADSSLEARTFLFLSSNGLEMHLLGSWSNHVPMFSQA